MALDRKTEERIEQPISPEAEREIRLTPAQAAAQMRINVPTRGNRKLRTLVARVNEDTQLKAWWHVANVNATARLEINDHSWVHVQIVANIALKLLRQLTKHGVQPSLVSDYRLTANESEIVVVLAALLHDIGMASVGDGVTHCDRPLTTIERALLKLHPQIAADILAEAPSLRGVVPIVYHHHEWFDGHGYGHGIAGETIPIGARILAVADAYVAMTSERPYRGAFTVSDALAELEDKAGTQFDPSVVAALSDILRGGTKRVPDPSDRTF
ncbi:MAG: HD domain-containing protein [Coriobacteriia bacterium]|nr:HD domain-containing protein [Coriobacteriia bacterium]